MPPFIAPPDPFDDDDDLFGLQPRGLARTDNPRLEAIARQLGSFRGAIRPPQLLGEPEQVAGPERPRLNLRRRDVSGLIRERDERAESGGSTRAEKIIAGLGLATSAIGALAGSPGLAGAGEIAATSAAIPGERRRERRDTGIATLEEQIAGFGEQNRRSEERETLALFNQQNRDFDQQARQARADEQTQNTLQRAIDTEGRRNTEFDRRRGLSPTLIEQARIDASNRSNRGGTTDDPEKARRAAVVQAEKDRKQGQIVVRLESKLRLDRQRVTAVEERLAEIGRSPTLLSGDEAVKLRAELARLNESVFVLESELDSFGPTSGAPSGERARRRRSGDPKFGGAQGSGGDDGLDEELRQLEEEIRQLEQGG